MVYIRKPMYIYTLAIYSIRLIRKCSCISFASFNTLYGTHKTCLDAELYVYIHISRQYVYRLRFFQIDSIRLYVPRHHYHVVKKELHTPFPGYLLWFTIHSPIMQHRNNRRRHCFKSKKLLSQEASASPSTLLEIIAAWKK